MTKIKLCGLMSPEDMDYVNELMPEYVGFMYVRESKRYRRQAEFMQFRERLNPKIISVGVFKDQDPALIEEAVKSGAINVIQLHGSEDESYIKGLRGKLNVNIIKAFALNDEQSAKAANESTADFILLDAPGGGSGKSFDHRLLEHVKRDYFLAGGLNPDNVAGLVKEYSPFAVDVSSGIESGNIKDHAKMRAFIRAVRDIK